MPSLISCYDFWWYSSKKIVKPQDFPRSQESFLSIYINIPLLLNYFFISLNFILSWLNNIGGFGKVLEFINAKCFFLVFPQTVRWHSHIFNCSHFYLIREFFFAINNESMEVYCFNVFSACLEMQELIVNYLRFIFLNFLNSPLNLNTASIKSILYWFSKHFVICQCEGPILSSS